MSPSAPGQRPTANAPNLLLRAHRETLRGAWRHPLTPGCGPAQSAALQDASLPAPAETTPNAKRSSLVHVPIVVSTVGDNILIPPSVGKKLLYEIFVWNVASQTLQFFQGPSASGILKLRLTNFPALTGFTLPFGGSWDQPHWEIEDGQPLILNLGAAAEVDGFIRYRIPNANF